MKQMMIYVLHTSGDKCERREIETNGERIYDMTDYVVEKLVLCFE